MLIIKDDVPIEKLEKLGFKYKKESELYKIGMIRINQLNQILHKYSF